MDVPKEAIAHLSRRQRRTLRDWLGRDHLSVSRDEWRSGSYFVSGSEKGDGRVTHWWPETPDERAVAEVLYNAVHKLGAFALRLPPGDPVRRSPDEWALIRAILADREDDLRHLVYADYLTERGDSQGDYIRACIICNQTPEDDPAYTPRNAECDRLLAEGAEAWFRPLTEMGLRPRLGHGSAEDFFPVLWMGNRGVIEEVTVDRPGLLPGAADRLFAAAPFLRKLKFKRGHLDPVGLRDVPQLAQIDELDLSRTDLTPDGLAALCECPHMTRLQTLSLSGNLGDEGVRVLVRSGLFSRLTALRVSAGHLTADGVRALAASPACRLQSLSIAFNTIDAGGFQALAESAALAGLTALDIGYTELDRAGVAALAAARFAGSLHTLRAYSATDDPQVAEALAALPFPRVRVLELNSNPFTPAAAAILARGTMAATVRELKLERCQLENGGLAALAGGRFPELRELTLSRNRIGAAGLAALATADPFSCLTSLNLWDNQIGPDGAAVLGRSPAFARLRSLDLTGNPIGKAGAVALAESEYLTELKFLNLDAAAVRAKGRKVLRRRFGEEIVRFV